MPSLSFTDDAVERSRIFSPGSPSWLVAKQGLEPAFLAPNAELFPPHCIVSYFGEACIYDLRLFLILLLLNSSLSFLKRGEQLVKEVPPLWYALEKHTHTHIGKAVLNHLPPSSHLKK